MKYWKSVRQTQIYKVGTWIIHGLLVCQIALSQLTDGGRLWCSWNRFKCFFSGWSDWTNWFLTKKGETAEGFNFKSESLEAILHSRCLVGMTVHHPIENWWPKPCQMKYGGNDLFSHFLFVSISSLCKLDGMWHFIWCMRVEGTKKITVSQEEQRSKSLR